MGTAFARVACAWLPHWNTRHYGVDDLLRQASVPSLGGRSRSVGRCVRWWGGKLEVAADAHAIA